MDRLNHCFALGRGKASGARVFALNPHKDMNYLEKIFKRVKNYGMKLVATDAVFSMDGDNRSLKDIVSLAKNTGR